MNSMKSQKDRALRDELPRSEGAQYLLEISGEITPERMKQLGQSRNDTQFWMCLLVKVKSDAVKNWNVRNWNVRSMNQGKLDVVKQEMARVIINILGINELKWIGMSEFNSDDHISTTVSKNPIELE